MVQNRSMGKTNYKRLSKDDASAWSSEIAKHYHSENSQHTYDQTLHHESLKRLTKSKFSSEYLNQNNAKPSRRG